MKKTIIILIIIVVIAFASVTVYDVELSYNDNFTEREVRQTFLAMADSINEISFFCGSRITSAHYVCSIEDIDGKTLGNAHSDSAGLFEYELVSATFDPPIYVRKGFTYQVHIKHSRSNLYSTNFYYNRRNPYKDGKLIGGGLPDTYDLAMRIKGVNDFPRNLFGMNSHLLMTYRLHPDSFLAMDKWDECIATMKDMGITWDRVGVNAWQHFQRDTADIDTFHYGWCDSLMKLYAQDSINVLWYFWMSTKWAGSDSVYNNWGVYYSFPRNLFEPVLDGAGNINLNNYFGQYVYKFVERYGPNGHFWQTQGIKNPIKHYEMWCEPEWGIRDDWWGDTATIIDPYYDSLINAEGDTTSLIDVYARLCIVGDSVVHIAAAEHGVGDSVFTLVYLPYHHWASPGDSEYWPRSNVWLQRLSDKGVHDYCNGMAIHAYATKDWGLHNRQKLTLDSSWIFIKNSAFHDKFLWCTEHSTGCYKCNDDSSEIAFPVQTDEQLATLNTFYSNDAPQGSLTNSFLWCFTNLYYKDNEKPDTSTLFCITRADFSARPPGYGFDQLTALLKNTRFNQCLTMGSSYDTIRVYEFENQATNKKVYVGWKEWGVGGDSVSYGLPLRTNAGQVEQSARSADPVTYVKSADTRGYVQVGLDTIPKFIYEPVDSTLRRPDLVIDSIWTSPAFPRHGDSVTVFAMLRNIDNVQATSDTIYVKCYNNDTLFVVDTITAQIKPESTLISSPSKKVLATKGMHLGKAVVNPESPFVEHDFTNNAQYRLYNVPYRPTGSIKINNDSTYANVPFVALNLSSVNPNDTLNPPADSMKIWQYYTPQGETLRYTFSTNWIAYDSTYCWYLLDNEGKNKIQIRYKVGPLNESNEYADSIIFDKTMPTGSFVINNNDKFTNSPNVTIKNSLSDAKSGVFKMRYGSQILKNLVQNSAFDNTGSWQKDTAVYHDSLKLFEIPVETNGNFFCQSIPLDSLSAFYNDTLSLSLDLVSEGFVGSGKVQVQYIYKPDTLELGDHPYGASVTIPQGANANVSQYNLSAFFKYTASAPDEVRIGVFIIGSSANAGRLFIDNLRLDPVSPYNDYTRFSDYDSLKSWTLTSGNGARKVYGQFADGAGNETDVSFDTIIVDTTKPARKITSPRNGWTISDTIEILGWAYDYTDPQQHFQQYELKYASTGVPGWYGVHPDSMFMIPVNQNLPPRRLSYWDTKQVTRDHGDGWYLLRLTVQDSAANYRDTTVTVNIDNDEKGEGEMAGFSNYLYGLAAGSEIYIGETQTGNIYKYNQNYQPLDTFSMQDSAGIGYPLAMAFADAGKLWAINLTSQTVNRYNNQGNLELRFSGNFYQPSGIALDSAGNIWVSDRMHHKIKKFDAQGNQVFAFGTKGSAPGKVNEPLGIAVSNDKIYLADSKNKRVSVFDTTGTFVAIIGDSAGLSLPYGIVVDSTGCVFVSDIIGNKVIEFEPYGSVLYMIDSLLDAPSCLALSVDERILYVSDTRHKRVVAYQVRGEPLKEPGGPMGGEAALNLPFRLESVYPNPAKNLIKVRFSSPDKHSVELKMYDAMGRLVRRQNIHRVSPGMNEISLKIGELGSGVYFLRISDDHKHALEKVILLK